MGSRCCWCDWHHFNSSRICRNVLRTQNSIDVDTPSACFLSSELWIRWCLHECSWNFYISQSKVSCHVLYSTDVTANSGAGWGVAIVSAGMSLSVAFTIFITGQYSKLIHCTEVHSFTCMYFNELTRVGILLAQRVLGTWSVVWNNSIDRIAAAALLQKVRLSSSFRTGRRQRQTGHLCGEFEGIHTANLLGTVVGVLCWDWIFSVCTVGRRSRVEILQSFHSA
jgi:hypothetical protein